ncbi:hypothetical protein Tsubulata_021659, partial [Turnera subulata]
MRERFSKLVFYFIFISVKLLSIEVVMAQNTTIIPVKVGVVLDLDSGEAAKIGWSCINMAINDFYTTNSHYKTRMILNFRDSMSDVIGAAAA